MKEYDDVMAAFKDDQSPSGRQARLAYHRYLDMATGPNLSWVGRAYAEERAERLSELSTFIANVLGKQDLLTVYVDATLQAQKCLEEQEPWVPQIRGGH